MSITEKQALAIRKVAGAKLRKAGLPDDLARYDVSEIKDTRAAHTAKKAIVAIARELLDGMAGADEDRAAELDVAHTGLMAVYDGIESRLDTLNGKSRRPMMADGTASGASGFSTSTDEPAEAFTLRSGQSFTDYTRERAGEDEFGGVSTGAYLRAMVLGPKGDVERRALAEGTDSSGGYTVPDILSARMIDRLRAASVVFRAGAQTVPLASDQNYIAKVATDPAPGWRNENALVAESDPTFGRVALTPRSLMVMVRVSRELLEDSLNMETILPQIMAAAMAGELDRVALLGSGTAPEPRGVVNFTGLTANAFAGGALSGYGALITARTALRTANSDATGYVMAPRDDGTLAGLTATDGQPLQVPPAIAGVPILTTTAIPVNGGVGTNESSIIAGDWSRLMVGIRSELRIEVLKERFADVNQYAFVAHLRADVAAEQEAAFTVLDGITA
ncbi:phage major capsid protein [Aurantimonas sp. C2-5-R2]|uniref:phage major capsid protein n=1 Tax=Aurantimonas sp. C2-5-R2 TaxID=3113713 RepID=UPI002F94E235